MVDVLSQASWTGRLSGVKGFEVAHIFLLEARELMDYGRWITDMDDTSGMSTLARMVFCSGQISTVRLISTCGQ